jgi:hypothetical protein
MRTFTAQQSPFSPSSRLPRVMLAGAFCACTLLCATSIAAQSSTHPPATTTSSKSHPSQTRSHRHLKKPEPAPVVETPPPPPPPDWPVNDKPNPASVVWDATGLRINASNSSLQQILSEVSTETGTKVEGLTADQRVYGDYGPGKARDVLSQLLQGSGYNVLLAGDIGQGAPRELVLSPLRSGPNGPPNTAMTMNRPQQESDEDVPEQPEDQPPIQAPQNQNNMRPGFGPNGPVRTPQQVMEEMQQRQILQQQQMQEQQQQQQQQNPQQ